MTDEKVYEAARKRAKAKLDFMNHALVYGVVNAFLIVINLITSPGSLWFYWPLLGWGVALTIHGIKVFILPEDSEMLDRLTEIELKKPPKPK